MDASEVWISIDKSISNQFLNQAGKIIQRHTQIIKFKSISLSLRLITPHSELWHATEEKAVELFGTAPFWSFFWPGSWGLCQYFHTTRVPYSLIIDIGSGCGAAAIVSLSSPPPAQPAQPAPLAQEQQSVLDNTRRARMAIVNDIDPFALAASSMNGDLNKRKSCSIDTYMESKTDTLAVDMLLDNTNYLFSHNGIEKLFQRIDQLGYSRSETCVLLGDMCYDEELRDQTLQWSNTLAQQGIDVYLGDPNRHNMVQYAQQRNWQRIATYDLPDEVMDANHGYHTVSVLGLYAETR